MSNKTIVVFNGNSVSGVLCDIHDRLDQMLDGTDPANSRFLIVTMDNDRLSPPEEFPSVEVSKFVPEEGTRYIIVVNGGTSAQLTPVLLRCQTRGQLEAVFNVQRESNRKLWPEASRS